MKSNFQNNDELKSPKRNQDNYVIGYVAILRTTLRFPVIAIGFKKKYENVGLVL